MLAADWSVGPSFPIPHSMALRVGISGAGVSGLAVAGILSKRLGPLVSINIFERSKAGSDQGYGLDLDENGQLALAQAGLFDKYWDISRLHSDVMAIYPLRGDTPLAVIYGSPTLQRLFPSRFFAQPESNRTALRDVFLDALLDRGVTVSHGCAISSATELNDGSIALHTGSTMFGPFDVVVDACGVHSPLRHHRVLDPDGKVFSGRILIHGVIDCPEVKLPPAVVQRLAEGTLTVAGRGYSLVLQRFGCRPEDKRSAFFYSFFSTDEHAVHRAAGLPQFSTRVAATLRDDMLRPLQVRLDTPITYCWGMLN